MKNNNAAIVRKITRRALSSDKRNNFFVTVAITLTTLLLSFVFSVGMLIIGSYNMHQIRLMGTAAHAAINRPSAEELIQLKNLDYVKTVGASNYVAAINNTMKMGDMNLALHFCDKTEWEKLRSPAYTDIVGKYPQKEDEIMVPHWILENMNIEPQIGMEIPIFYTVETDNKYIHYDDVFILSGWFTSYDHIGASGNNSGNILVSEELSLKYGKTIEKDGVATVMFSKSTNVSEYCSNMERDLSISDSERVRLISIYDFDSEIISTLIAVMVIVVFLIFTGYLLIYNVLYISVARNVRFYGLLKTIGTTPRQIRQIVVGQMLCLCTIGIPLGAALAFILSLKVLPLIMVNSSTGMIVSFSPLIYMGSAVFALLTAFLGAAKPAKKAANISPIEAQKYTGTEVRKKYAHSFSQGKPYRMALRNIFRDRKRAVVVFLSLFLGITTFITVITLVSSINTDNYVDFFYENDFMLINNTVNISDSTEQKFDEEFLSKVKNISGFEHVQYDTLSSFRMTYAECFDDYLRGLLLQMFGRVFDDIKEIPPEEIESVKENFKCLAIGIDGSALAELEGSYDIEAFERGEYALISTYIQSNLDVVESVEIRSDEDGSVFRTIPIRGIAPESFHNNGYLTAPTIIISNKLMKQLVGEAIRSKLYIDISDGYDKEFLEGLKVLTDGDYEISRISKIEIQNQLRNTKIMFYIMGGGIAVVLALIGVLNFVNVMSVSVMVRKRELATLESVGMSRNQVRKLLISEGLGYAVITLFLVLSIGNGITYGIFKLFQQQAGYAIFTYPIIPMSIVIIIILVICFITPQIAYRGISKKTLVERLREAE